MPIVIINPETQKPVRVDGSTYKKLSRQYSLDTLSRFHQPEIRKVGGARSSATRGWHTDAPLKGQERHILKRKCGNKCFLQPKSEGFPICPKCQNGQCSCQVDCRGVTAAKTRARQYRHADVLKMLAEIGKQC